jgi:hypothetical protein
MQSLIAQCFGGGSTVKSEIIPKISVLSEENRIHRSLE